jgi:hypothetical protein
VTESSPASQGTITEDQALQLIAFLVSSAEICQHEPIYYGTFRLIDAASRLMGYMLESGDLQSEAFIQELKAEIDLKKTWMMWDRDAYFQFLRETPGKVAIEIAQRADEVTKEGASS